MKKKKNKSKNRSKVNKSKYKKIKPVEKKDIAKIRLRNVNQIFNDNTRGFELMKFIKCALP